MNASRKFLQTRTEDERPARSASGLRSSKARLSSTTSRSAYTPDSEILGDMSLRDRARPRGRACRPDWRGQIHHHELDCPLLRSRLPAWSRSTVSDISKFSSNLCANRSVLFCRTPCCSMDGVAEHRVRQARGHRAGNHARPPNWPMRMNSLKRCRRAMTRSSANAA